MKAADVVVDRKASTVGLRCLLVVVGVVAVKGVGVSPDGSQDPGPRVPPVDSPLEKERLVEVWVSSTIGSLDQGDIGIPLFDELLAVEDTSFQLAKVVDDCLVQLVTSSSHFFEGTDHGGLLVDVVVDACAWRTPRALGGSTSSVSSVISS